MVLIVSLWSEKRVLWTAGRGGGKTFVRNAILKYIEEIEAGVVEPYNPCPPPWRHPDLDEIIRAVGPATTHGSYSCQPGSAPGSATKPLSFNGLGPDVSTVEMRVQIVLGAP